MLVLSRKAEQTIQIGENITITILKIKGSAISVGVEAPREVRVIRGEIAHVAKASDVGSTSEENAVSAASPQRVAKRGETKGRRVASPLGGLLPSKTAARMRGELPANRASQPSGASEAMDSSSENELDFEFGFKPESWFNSSVVLG